MAIVSRVEIFRNRPKRALEAHEKAWRATVTSSTQVRSRWAMKSLGSRLSVLQKNLLRRLCKFGLMDREDQKMEGDAERRWLQVIGDSRPGVLFEEFWAKARNSGRIQMAGCG